MKFGGGLGSTGMLSSILRVQACSRVLNRVFLPGKNFKFR